MRAATFWLTTLSSATSTRPRVGPTRGTASTAAGGAAVDDRRRVGEASAVAGRDFGDGCCFRACGERGALETGREPEHAALAGLAHDAELAAHQLDQPLGDHEAEPGAAVAPGRGSVRLREGLEQAPQRVRSDADPGIAHREADAPALRRSSASDADAHRDLAPLGELDGVADEVDQGLAQPAGVAAQDVGDAVLDRRRQVDAPWPWPGARRGESPRPRAGAAARSTLSSARWPDSIFEKSRMSSMMRSSARPELPMVST